MNMMPVISVAVFLVLAGGALIAYRWFRRDAEDSDGVFGINECGESGTSERGDMVGKVE